MTIVYDPLTYRTVVARPGEIPYKFWSVNKHVIDAASAGICTLHSGDEAPGDTTKLWLDLTLPENAVGAVKAYDGASWVALTPALFYSHIAGGAGGFVTDLEMATYVSGLIGVSLQAWGENLDQWSAIDPTAKEDTGVAATLDAAHLAAGDPHPQYLTAAEGAAAYQPLDSDLTAIAALTTTAYGRAFLALADAAAGRTALGLGTLATQSGTFSGTSSGTNTGDQTITLTGDVTGSGTGSFAATLATVNANTGSWGLAGSVAQFVVNAKGLITSAANVAISIASTAISDATAAGRSMLTAANAAAQTALLSAFVGDSGAGGTKGLVPAPIAGDATKFLKGDGTFASIPGGGDALTANPLSQFAATTSLQLKNTISDETGSGALVFATSPTLVTPALGTPVSGSLTNCTGLPVSTGISGLGTGITTLLASTYETGTWTPAVSFATPGNLSVSYTIQTGQYVKIGALVYIYMVLQFTPTYTTASGAVAITGMPFSAADTNVGGVLGGQLAGLTYPASRVFPVIRFTSGTNIGVVAFASGFAASAITTTQMPSGTAQQFIFTVCYRT